MPAPKWFIVAKNEYRIRTSSIRAIRPYLPFIVVVLLALYVFFGAPALVSPLTNEFVSFFLSQVAVAMIQIVLFMFFIFFITFPINYTLRDVQTGQQEIFLKAPIKPSHVLLGEFLGELPLYAIIIVAITGFFTAVLKPIGLNMIQMAIIVLVFVITLSSALWIGTVISALLRTKLGGSSRGRDIGKALALLIVFPALVLMYALMGGGMLETLADPGTGSLIKTILGVMPSSWGAEVITSFASHPGDIAAVGAVTVTRFGGLLAFFVVTLWAGIRIADRAYSLETTTFTGSKAKQDGAFYTALKQRGPFSTLFVTIFKVYTRRLQNLSWIAYIVGLLVIINIFFTNPNNPVGTVVMSFFIFPVFAAVVSADITLRGKETLFIYRKTPSGENRFIKAMLLKGWAVAVPIAAVLTIVPVLLSPQAAVASLVTNTVAVVLMVAADIAFASGLFLLMPAYTEKGGEFVLDTMVIMMVSMGLFAVTVIVFDEILMLPLLHWVVGITFLYLGKINLSSIE